MSKKRIALILVTVSVVVVLVVFLFNTLRITNITTVG